MIHSYLVWLVGFVSLVVFSATSPSCSEDEPTVRGKKASEWTEILQKDPKLEKRQAALIALRILGPKVPGVVTGASSGLNDPASSIRQSAAQVLGEMGAAAEASIPALARALH